MLEWAYKRFGQSFLFQNGQGATNPVHNLQMCANEVVVYAKFLETVQKFALQYNILFRLL